MIGNLGKLRDIILRDGRTMLTLRADGVLALLYLCCLAKDFLARLAIRHHETNQRIIAFIWNIARFARKHRQALVMTSIIESVELRFCTITND